MTNFDDTRMRTPAHLRNYTTLKPHEREAFQMEARNRAERLFSSHTANPEFMAAVALELATLAKAGMNAPEPVAETQPESKRERIGLSIWEGLDNDA